MVTVEYHVDLKEVQSSARLAALLGDGAQRAPFDRLAWWQMLERHCTLPPLLAVAREGDNAVVLPLRRGRGRLEGLANWYSFRLAPVASAGADRLRLLTAIARDLARKTARIELAGVPDEDCSATTLARAFRKAGWVVVRSPCDSNHVLPLNGRSFARYLEDRPGPLRTTLKRKRGKVRTVVLTRFDAEAWQAYEAIYAQSWKPREGSPDFLRAFAEAEGAAGRLRLGLAFAGDGTPIAAQFWTVEGGTAWIHKLAHLETAKALSPGTVLSAALFEQVIDRDGVALVDFGTGDDPYKRDWMETVRPRYRLDLFRLGRVGNWGELARIALRRLAHGVKRG